MTVPDVYHFKFLCDVNRTFARRERAADGSDNFILYDDAKDFLKRVPIDDLALFTNMSRPSKVLKPKLIAAGVPEEMKLVSAGDIAISYAKRLSHELGYNGRVLGVGFPEFLKYGKEMGLEFVDPLKNGGPNTGVILVSFDDKYNLWEGTKLIEGAWEHSESTNKHVSVVYPDDEPVFDHTIDGRKVRHLGTGAIVKPILAALDDLGIYYREVRVGKPSLEWTEQLIAEIGWADEKRIFLVDDKNVKYTSPIFKSVQIMRVADGIEWKNTKKDGLLFKDLTEMLEELPARLKKLEERT